MTEQLLDVVGDGDVPRFFGCRGGEELDVSLGRQFADFENGAPAAGCKEGQEHRNLDRSRNECTYMMYEPIFDRMTTRPHKHIVFLSLNIIFVSYIV